MEYYQPQPIPPEKKDNTLLRLVLGGCGCLVLIGVIFGLFAGKIVETFRGPSRTVKAQVQALNNGDYREAYSMCSESYRRTVTLQEFRDQMQPFHPFLPYREVQLNTLVIKGRAATAGGRLIGRNGEILPVSYELVREKGDWRIARFEWTLPGNLQTA